ncbi:MAG: aminotransferase class I/II-fold pyridoxal phosphate-dependent enzyme [Candidatus Moranbacteria bacterium]|nr:aminotransferase class I/II-fold pyridoxal phosphate-dependent enzyme [Candidatus Moranbacteria bacterium]
MHNFFTQFNQSGVIKVMEEARKHGYTVSDKTWCNFGQGSAEPGIIKGAPERITSFKVSHKQNAYAPVSGLNILRQHTADLYNQLFRNKKNLVKFDLENVDISGGGRMALSRIIASLGKIKVAYFVPDYSSYEGILSVFNNIDPIPYYLKAQNNFQFNLAEFKKFQQKYKIKALILSNPSNPTGNVIIGRKLKALIEFAREAKFLIIFDEFYFNYLYDEQKQLFSATEYLKNIEKDPIIIISGLSKSWRYSGWRVCWSLGPKKIIQKLSIVGSFLDGGTSNPLQNASLQIINRDNLIKETKAINRVFTQKRNLLVENLQKLDFIVNKPKGSFYVWANVKNLAEPINTGIKFFNQALREKFIVVPGKYFDLNPHRRRRKLNMTDYVRFSFGPNLNQIKIGIRSIHRLIEKFR